MVFWLKKLAQNPLGIGALAPSSPHLARLMAGFLPPEGRVLELGPGTGAITDEILERVPAERLELIEADAELAAACKSRYPGVRVMKGDAEDVLASSQERYDAIVSGIPFAGMDKAKRQRIFRLVNEHLLPGGVFVMFQYSLTTHRELQQEFGRVQLSFMPWNVPPAFVYTASKPKGDTA